MNLSQTKQIALLSYGAFLIFLSFITFIAYASDKQKAKSGNYRTKEKTLLLLSFLGGAFGGYPAMLLFHHKTNTTPSFYSFLCINNMQNLLSVEKQKVFHVHT